MADALCGPSNALQTFQKQTSVDRTLQQDRVAARQAQVENFRSLPGPNAGILDAEFEAFQAGPRLIESRFPEQPFFNAGPAATHQPSLLQSQPSLSNWASDFQNLNISEARASPIPQSQYHQHAPLQRRTSAGWHQDFLRHQNQSPSNQAQQQQRPGTGWSYGYTGGLVPQQDSILSPIAQQKQPERQAEHVYDEAAFERAFNAAGLSLEQTQHRQDPRDTQLDQDLYRSKDALKDLGGLETENWLDHGRIGADRILDEAQERRSQDRETGDADDLARTAGQLLENVKGDQSRKFQESNFLSLMRQLRDKEVRVEGDKLVDVTQDLHPGGERYPNEPPVDSDSNQGVPDPVFQYDLEAADGSYGIPVDTPLSDPGLQDDSEWEPFWQNTRGGENQSMPTEDHTTSSISPITDFGFDFQASCDFHLEQIMPDFISGPSDS